MADDFRIRAALPDLALAARTRAPRSWPARTSGVRHDMRDPRWEMDPVRERLAALCPGVELGENLRFSPGEKANDPAFVASLIEGFDAYVNEAFGVAHRPARLHRRPAAVPARVRPGLRLAREVEVLGGILARPARPFVAVVGGAKVADKLEVLRGAGPQGGHAGRRGRHGVHLPGRPGPATSGAPCSTWTTLRTAGPSSTPGLDILPADRHPGPRAGRHLRARRRGRTSGRASR